jgi:hypothetical protein
MVQSAATLYYREVYLTTVYYAKAYTRFQVDLFGLRSVRNWDCLVLSGALRKPVGSRGDCRVRIVRLLSGYSPTLPLHSVLSRNRNVKSPFATN